MTERRDRDERVSLHGLDPEEALPPMLEAPGFDTGPEVFEYTEFVEYKDSDELSW